MDPYEGIAIYYDCEHADFYDDIDFYLNLIDTGPVLDLGAGTGRISLALARAGLEVWCVDSSEAMLGRARERLAAYENARFVQSSIADLQLSTRSAVALLSLNTLWHLPDPPAQLNALEAIRRHLVEEGTLLIDLSNPFTMADRGANGEVRQRFDRLCDGVRVVGTSAAWDDQAEQRLSLSLVYDETRADGTVRRSHAPLVLRYTYRFELELLLRLADFRPAHIYGSYDFEPYSADSPNLIVVARASGSCLDDAPV